MSNNIHGPISYIRSLGRAELASTSLNRVDLKRKEKVLSLGDKFLTKVNPKIVEYLEEGRK
jgi:hypothetical protein